ncbi:unnamed protein product [Gadus morhua 'NCC']
MYLDPCRSIALVGGAEVEGHSSSVLEENFETLSAPWIRLVTTQAYWCCSLSRQRQRYIGGGHRPSAQRSQKDIDSAKKDPFLGGPRREAERNVLSLVPICRFSTGQRPRIGHNGDLEAGRVHPSA